MDMFTFEWDEHKNVINQLKHKIAFEEAMTVFYDVNARVIRDEDYSIDEDRFLILGVSANLHLMVVCHCYRGRNENIIRIISARKATKTETNQYNGGFEK